MSSATNVLPSANIQWTISPEVVGTAIKHASFETFMGPQARPPLQRPGPRTRVVLGSCLSEHHYTTQAMLGIQF
jgi:hypothetical protein